MNRARAGFTLIELLIVVVIIGILAAIAVPKFQNTKGKAYLASMKSDLRNVATLQEAYFYDHAFYSATLDSLKFVTSPGVQIIVNESTTAGWSATSTHLLAFPHTCTIFSGTAVPVPPAVAEGVVACN
jgi:type IV pilus assembly protein PilA